MIVTTVGKILEAVPILREISDYKFKAKLAFKIAKIIQESEKEMKNFEQARQIIFQKYGELDEHGMLKVENQQIKIQDNYIEDYNREVKELLNVDVELVTNPIELEELEEMSFTPLQLIKISDFIKE